MIIDTVIDLDNFGHFGAAGAFNDVSRIRIMKPDDFAQGAACKGKTDDKGDQNMFHDVYSRYKLICCEGKRDYMRNIYSDLQTELFGDLFV